MGLGSARFHSITAEERKLVLDSWSIIRPQMRDFSISVFLLMLNDYPHLGHYWSFKGANDDSFERFTRQFIREFDILVMNMDRPSRIVPVLQKNAEYHVIKNIPNEDYDRLRKCIVSTIGERVGDQAGRHEIIAAWIKCISIAFSFITEMMADIAYEQK